MLVGEIGEVVFSAIHIALKKHLLIINVLDALAFSPAEHDFAEST